MKKSIKKVVATILGMSLILSLCACGTTKTKENKNVSYEDAATTKALVCAGYDIYLSELIMYAFQTAYIQRLPGDMDAATVKSHKDMVLSMLRTNKILYDVAVNNNVTLNEKDMEYVNQTIGDFKNVFSAEYLSRFGITDEIVDNVFKEQAIISKFQNDTKYEIKQNKIAELEKEFGDKNFHTLYYMMFPTVKVDDEGNPVKDDSDNYVYLSDKEKKDMLKKAEEAKKEIEGGKSYIEVAEKYGITPYCSESTGYDGAYDDKEKNDKICALKTGQCLDPYEDKISYILVVMVNDNDTEKKQSYIEYTADQSVSDEFTNMESVWFANYKVDEAGDMEGTVWADFSFLDLIKDMQKNKIY